MLVLQAGPPEGKTHRTHVQSVRSRESTAVRICKVQELQRTGCKFSLQWLRVLFAAGGNVFLISAGDQLSLP